MSGPTTLPVQTRVESSLVTLNIASSLGEVVVVSPTPSPQAAYERALALIEATRKEIATVTRVKGPDVAPNALDVWMQQNKDPAGAVALTTSILSCIASVGWFMAGEPTTAVCAGAAGAAAALAVARIVGAQNRIYAAREKRRTDVIDTADLDRMLASVRKAKPEERALVEPFVRKELGRVDTSLSAKAAATRDRLLQGLPTLDPVSGRAARLAFMVDSLRHGGELRSILRQLRALFAEASAEERSVLAANLEAGAFEGERALARGEIEDIRALYALIEEAQRPGPEATSEKAKLPS